MEPKTYRAKSIQAAIGMIKEELGKDAVILSTRRVPKNVRNPYGPDLFEVKASLQAIPGPGAPKVPNPSLSSQSNRSGRFDEEASQSLRELKKDIGHIKELFFLIGKEDGLTGILTGSREGLDLYAALIKSGMSEKRARGCVEICMDRIKGDAAFADSHTEALSRMLLKEVLSSLSIKELFPPEIQPGRIAALVGPTGVGKTTTIAKLAAYYTLKKKKSVGLISIDNYRIGAVDQLKAYASIMNIPCVPAFTPEDFQVALKKMRHKEMILVDTAGHSHLDGKRMDELRLFFKKEFQVTNHLVLSANMDREDMREAISCFGVLSPETYLFTKLDETRKRLTMADQAMELKLPISCLTHGQNVPDDIVFATPVSLLKLMFEEVPQMKNTLARLKKAG